MRKISFIATILFCISNFGLAQNQSFNFEWNTPSIISHDNNSPSTPIFNLSNGFPNYDLNFLPTYSELIPIEQNCSGVIYNVINITTTPLTDNEKNIDVHQKINSSPIIKTHINTIRGKKHLNISIVPLVSKAGMIHKVTFLELSLDKTFSNVTNRRTQSNPISPIEMRLGEWFKYAIVTSGPQKITYEDLLSNGVLSAPVKSNTINLYGNEGRMIPYLSSEKKPSTLQTLKCQMVDQGDTEFGTGDYILFYGEEGNKIEYDKTDDNIKRISNFYSDTNFVFVKLNESNPERITQVSNSLTSTLKTIKSYDNHFHHENDLLNFIKSGRIWVGENLQDSNPQKFTINTNHITSEPISFTLDACARSQTASNNRISIIVNGDTIGESYFSTVSSVYHNDYVKFVNKQFVFPSDKKELEVEIYYHRPEANSLAWINYFSINFLKEAELNDSPFNYISKEAIKSPGNYKYQFTSTNDKVKVWNVDDYNHVSEIKYSKEEYHYHFHSNSSSSENFLIFSEDQAHTPVFIEDINNQKLNYSSVPNYLIITHPRFLKQANRLAEFHKKESGLTTSVVNTEHIYNMHSSGRKEAGAIRDYIKYLYEQSTPTDSLKYVLLFGSGSYDPKNRLNNNQDLVPTYQSLNSAKLTSSYVTDDFYAVLDDNEGDFINNDQLDIATGRFPVKTIEEAEIAVTKVKQYYGYFSSKKDNGEEYTNKGDWRNNILFVADDGDLNEHMKQGEVLATMVDTGLPNLNIDKVLIDSYIKETPPSGTTANGAKESIFRKIQDGALIVNYTGHGGEYGWASERILDINNIFKLTNRDKLPLVMTATCEFSRFDDPERVSAGEYLYLKENGGAIALFTTVRLVFSIPNFNLNKHFYRVLMEEKNGIRLGDLFRRTKTNNNAGTNDRNFTLLGDPALKLAVPERDIVVDSISAWSSHKTDTLKALTQATIYGTVKENRIIDQNFNGELEVKIYDQAVTKKTLNNEGKVAAFEYNSQSSLLFVGTALVKNGKYSIDIILPKNTLSSYGKGKISMYAINANSIDAAGNNKQYIIGGLDNSAPTDSEGPQIKLFLNDTTFAFGDRVLPSPYLIAQLSDNSGINVTSNNIENNIVAVVNNSSEHEFVLNNEYQTKVNTYKSGSITYQLKDIEKGQHSLVVSASDNYNNRSTERTEFIIEENAKLALEYVLNYPNPFTTNTGFYFEQNQLSADLDIQIQIYSITGKLIKTIITHTNANTRRIGPIQWDGKDDFGDPIGRGVYIYKISVVAENGTTAEQIEKLVILK